jgi:predicted Zn-dependent protease with MMP-like domain
MKWWRYKMITIEEMEVMLDEIAEELPQEFYKELNGGILLLPETKRNTEVAGTDLYIMGQYHRSGNLGRYISIYYGSFIQLYGHLSSDKLKDRLRQTLKHEFRHHLESLAGDRSLEKQDEQDMVKYASRALRRKT